MYIKIHHTCTCTCIHVHVHVYYVLYQLAYIQHVLHTCTFIPDLIIHMKIHVPSMLTIGVEIINKQTK